MHFSRANNLPQCLIALLFTTFAAAAGPTSIFINQVQPQYDALSPCAEAPLRTIVRNMAFDCGDGSQTTSYACFCFSSSAKVVSRITSMINKNCTSEAEADQVTSAADIFSKYCQLGALTIVGSSATGLVTSSSPTPSTSPSPSHPSSPSASPAAGASTTLSTPTPSSTPPPTRPSTPEKKTPVVAIAVGVSVPVAVIALGLMSFLLYRRRNRDPPTQNKGDELHTDGQIMEADNESNVLQPKVEPVEIGDSRRRAELATLAKEDIPGDALPAQELDGGENR
ncbi:hypothetical protein CC80DRAFT_493621 [Byssothecium circinans]|uniref:Extracellular membrane protein CFEM domain-containing protein n=1 Tax=Byssothecium circinans TaxID=147558 RepID=A0A6A5TT35_9PLEO|nr:hypothetical protein CC80DRAFT_493621 [Byssothecium circinans]